LKPEASEAGATTIFLDLVLLHQASSSLRSVRR